MMHKQIYAPRHILSDLFATLIRYTPEIDKDYTTHYDVVRRIGKIRMQIMTIQLRIGSQLIFLADFEQALMTYDPSTVDIYNPRFWDSLAHFWFDQDILSHWVKKHIRIICYRWLFGRFEVSIGLPSHNYVIFDKVTAC